MPVFTVQTGYDKSRDIPIGDGETLIGRELDCDIILDTPNASRHHARVLCRENKVTIEDLNSSNGTFVNSTPIDGQHELKHLDVCQIGDSVFLFRDTDVPADLRADGPKEGQRTAEYYTFPFMTAVIKKLQANIEKVIRGKTDVVRHLITSFLADGHLLIEDVPGVGKSVLAQALAKSVQGQYKRIQFTPDMLPSDITGLSIYDEKTKEFSFMPGPVFGNVILADEINRTTPRTQASLLECMSESVITIDGKPHVLPKPFFVIATQNPSDYHGTYPLPEPQLDRFLMRISIGYPSLEVEMEIISSQQKQHPLKEISYVATAGEIMQCQALVRQIHISEEIKHYIVNLVNATREHKALDGGCSPRASLALMRAGQSLAACYQRDFVMPLDIRELAVPVLAHRIRLKHGLRGGADTAAEIISEILKTVPVEGE